MIENFVVSLYTCIAYIASDLLIFLPRNPFPIQFAKCPYNGDSYNLMVISHGWRARNPVCVCVCVCERERERVEMDVGWF